MTVTRRLISRCRNPQTGVFNDLWYEFDDATNQIVRVGVTGFESDHPRGNTGRRNFSDKAHSALMVAFRPKAAGRPDVVRQRAKDAAFDEDLTAPDLPMRRITDPRGRARIKFDGAIQFSWDWGA